METARLRLLLSRTEVEDALVADQKLDEIRDKPIEMEMKRPDRSEKSWTLVSNNGYKVAVLE